MEFGNVAGKVVFVCGYGRCVLFQIEFVVLLFIFNVIYITPGGTGWLCAKTKDLGVVSLR